MTDERSHAQRPPGSTPDASDWLAAQFDHDHDHNHDHTSADAATQPIALPTTPEVAASGPARASLPPTASRRNALVLAIVVVFVLLLVVLFVVGRAIATPAHDAATPTVPTAPTGAPSPATHTAVPSPSTPPSTPPAAPAAAGPVAPGSHQWNDLRGGECLAAFQNAWQQTYQVVDCATPHAAQLVASGSLDAAPGSAYPGTATLAAQLNARCQAPGVVDLTAAKAYTDLRVSASYPATAEQWATGERSFACFVARAGGQDLTGSIAG